jgi:hypothetical protein
MTSAKDMAGPIGVDLEDTQQYKGDEGIEHGDISFGNLMSDPITE